MRETRYAIVTDGICTNIIVATPEVAEEWGLPEVPEGFGQGDLYDGTNWIKGMLAEPEPSEPSVEDQLLILANAMAEIYERMV